MVELVFDDNLSLSDALKGLDKYFNGKLYNILFDDNGKLKNGFHIAVNLNRINLNDSSRIRLMDGDIIAFLPAPAGG
ncbi:MAG: MoaD/ThiS family protein [Candidatus Methanomethylicia archaeon]